jgi:hypothetical protein
VSNTPSPANQEGADSEQRKSGANLNKKIAMPGVESGAARIRHDRPLANVCFKTTGLVHDAAALVNPGRQTRVGYTKQRAPILNCAKNRVRQMLSHNCRWPKVTIVRDIDQNAGAFFC